MVANDSAETEMLMKIMKLRRLAHTTAARINLDRETDRLTMLMCHCGAGRI